jgi:hypothetical protein
MVSRYRKCLDRLGCGTDRFYFVNSKVLEKGLKVYLLEILLRLNILKNTLFVRFRIIWLRQHAVAPTIPPSGVAISGRLKLFQNLRSIFAVSLEVVTKGMAICYIQRGQLHRVICPLSDKERRWLSELLRSQLI